MCFYKGLSVYMSDNGFVPPCVWVFKRSKFISNSLCAVCIVMAVRMVVCAYDLGFVCMCLKILRCL